MKFLKLTFLVYALLTIGFASTANALPYDFESGSAPVGMSGGNTQSTGGYSTHGFGMYFQWSGGSAITFDLTGLTTHTALNIEFDLAVIDSWDGPGTWGPDYFNVEVDGTSVFMEEMASYGGTPIVSGSNLYNSGWEDTAYHISLTGISHSASNVSIAWFANGPVWQGNSDESFAIDNITVSAYDDQQSVPEPATLFLFGTGIAGLAGIRSKTRKR